MYVKKTKILQLASLAMEDTPMPTAIIANNVHNCSITEVRHEISFFAITHICNS
jgi:hypothetical protein